MNKEKIFQIIEEWLNESGVDVTLKNKISHFEKKLLVEKISKLYTEEQEIGGLTLSREKESGIEPTGQHTSKSADNSSETSQTAPQLLEELRELKNRFYCNEAFGETVESSEEEDDYYREKGSIKEKAKSLKEQYDKVKGCGKRFKPEPRIEVTCSDEDIFDRLCPTCQKQNEEVKKILEEIRG